jgi:uncharacterized protein (DUF58 family)
VAGWRWWPWADEPSRPVARTPASRVSSVAARPWDAQVLSRVRHLHLKARVLTDSLMLGEHRSRRVGQAVEFSDYLEYQPGMDLRHIDWRVRARSDRWVVRRFEAETEIPCTVILDLSGDLSTGTGHTAGTAALPDLEGTKAGWAITFAATLLYYFQRHGEPVGLEIIGGESELASIPPRQSSNHLQQLFRVLAAARPGGRADLSEALLRVGQRTRRRSLVTVVTDGMEEPSAWMPALAALARRRVDLRFVHVHDRGELALEFPRAAMFFSPEGGDALAVDPEGARAEFSSVVEDYLREVRAGVIAWGGRYVSVATGDPMEAAMRPLLGAVGEPRWR